MSAKIELEDGAVVRRHYYQLVSRPVESPLQLTLGSVIPEVKQISYPGIRRIAQYYRGACRLRANPSCTTMPSESKKNPTAFLLMDPFLSPEQI